MARKLTQKTQVEIKWYEILQGIHAENGKMYGPDIIDNTTGFRAEQLDGRFIPSHRNLLKMNPPKGRGTPRFRLLNPHEVKEIGLKVPEDYPLPDGQVAIPSDSPRSILQDLSTTRLQSIAEDENVDLEGATDPNEIIDRIIDARQGKEGVEASV